MTKVQKRLFEVADKQYALFQAKLIPNIPQERVIGVRVPVLRKIAREFEKEPECRDFLNTLPHAYYDENMLHSILLSNVKNYEECIAAVEAFLPYVDNWAVCDTLRPKVFGKHKDKLLPRIKDWIASDKTYTCRFGIGMLMMHYLDKDFKPEYLELPQKVDSEEYYVKMMIAWFYATLWQISGMRRFRILKSIDFLTGYIKKTIQKACESYRITDEQKAYLKTLR